VGGGYKEFSVIRQGEVLYLSNLHNKLNDPWDETSLKDGGAGEGILILSPPHIQLYEVS
jgi:hypothetical protein